MTTSTVPQLVTIQSFIHKTPTKKAKASGEGKTKNIGAKTPLMVGMSTNTPKPKRMIPTCSLCDVHGDATHQHLEPPVLHIYHNNIY